MSEQNNISNSLAHTKWNCKYHMGIVEGDMADIEAYAEQLKRTMSGGGVTIDVPMLGTITLTAPDIDVIVNYINNAERGY